MFCKHLPASVFMAVSVYARYNPHRRWQSNQVEAKLALKTASIES